MARVVLSNDGNNIGVYSPPTKGQGGTGTKAIASKAIAGKITSTGGLTGSTGFLLTPYINTITGTSYIVVHDPTNFDTEENAEYDFRQEIPGNPPQEGRDVSVGLIILKYRELGPATFNVNVTVYRKLTDDFFTKQILVQITNKNKRTSFPDKKIHTVRLGLNPVISGERPQVSLTRSAGSGPIAITSLTLCVNADETPQF